MPKDGSNGFLFYQVYVGQGTPCTANSCSNKIFKPTANTEANEGEKLTLSLYHDRVAHTNGCLLFRKQMDKEFGA